MALRYCPNCRRNVDTYRGVSLFKLCFFLMLFIIPGLIYFFVIKERRCPMCNVKESMLERPRPYGDADRANSSTGPLRPLR